MAEYSETLIRPSRCLIGVLLYRYGQKLGAMGRNPTCQTRFGRVGQRLQVTGGIALTVALFSSSELSAAV